MEKDADNINYIVVKTISRYKLSINKFVKDADIRNPKFVYCPSLI